jgi:hypothetical protein
VQRQLQHEREPRCLTPQSPLPLGIGASLFQTKPQGVSADSDQFDRRGRHARAKRSSLRGLRTLVCDTRAWTKREVEAQRNPNNHRAAMGFALLNSSYALRASAGEGARLRLESVMRGRRGREGANGRLARYYKTRSPKSRAARSANTIDGSRALLTTLRN